MRIGTGFKHFWEQRDLVIGFTKRDFQGRYRSSYLGMLWSLLLPFILWAMYTFVFSFVFKARWGVDNEDPFLFAFILFAGLIPFNFFSEVMTSSSQIIPANTNLVKKVVFPLEVLPLSRALATLLHSVISLLVLLTLLICAGKISWTVLALPLVAGPLFLFAVGLSFVVASLSVFVRDTSQIIGVFMTLLLFMSPIFYPLEAIPEQFRGILLLNPLATVVDQFRVVVVLGQIPSLGQMAISWAVGLVVWLLGYFWFMKTKPWFADVL